MSLERFASRRGNSARSLALALVSMIGVSSLVPGCGGGDAATDNKAAVKPAADGADAATASNAGTTVSKSKVKIKPSSRREHQKELEAAAGK